VITSTAPRGFFLFAEVENLSRLAIVGNAEVFLPETIDRVPLAVDLGVDMHETNAGSERRLVLERQQKKRPKKHFLLRQTLSAGCVSPR
jgi:hypothetical protein